MESCEKYIKLISECIDGEISDADRSELEIHLEFCPECRRVAEAFASISGNFPKEEPVPENFTSGTMAKIKAEAAKPTGIKKFISGYGKYTGLAAALVVVLLGAHVFTGGIKSTSEADSSAYGELNKTNLSAPMAAADSVTGKVEMESDADYAMNDSIVYADNPTADGSGISMSPSTNDDTSERAPDYAPVPEPEATIAPGESQFSVTLEVTDVNELYKRMGYTERFYSVSRLYAPVPEDLMALLESSESTQIFRSLEETHYKVPMARLNELHPEVFTEIVFDDLTAEYGLVILMLVPAV